MAEEKNKNEFNIAALIYGIIALIFLFIGYLYSSNSGIELTLVGILGVIGLLLLIIGREKS